MNIKTKQTFIWAIFGLCMSLICIGAIIILQWYIFKTNTQIETDLIESIQSPADQIYKCTALKLSGLLGPKASKQAEIIKDKYKKWKKEHPNETRHVSKGMSTSGSHSSCKRNGVPCATKK